MVAYSGSKTSAEEILPSNKIKLLNCLARAVNLRDTPVDSIKELVNENIIDSRNAILVPK